MLHGLLKKKFKKGTTINDVQFNLYYDLIERYCNKEDI